MAISTAELLLVIRAQNLTEGAFHSVRAGLTGLAATAGAFAAVRVGAGIVEAATNYQKMTTQVMNNTTMGVTGMQQMRAGIEQLAAGSSAPLDELAQGWMRSTNLGFNAADTFKIVQAGMQSAVSTGSDVGETVNALANTMHEFSIPGQDAAKAMDSLHLAAAQGNMTLGQLVDGGGRALAMAANLHVPLNQVAAALAALTRHGMDLPTASTNVVGMLSKMVNPAKMAQGELAKLSLQSGINLTADFSPAGLASTGGLTKAMEDLNKATKGNVAEIFKVIPALRGGIGAMILTGTGTDDYKTILESLQQVTLGKLTPTAAAYAAWQRTASAAFGRMKNDAQLVAITLGGPLMNAAAGAARVISTGLLAALQLIQHPSAAFKAELAGIGAFLGRLVPFVLGGIGALVAWRVTMAGVGLVTAGVAVAQGAWNVVTTIGRGIQVAWTMALAVGGAIMAGVRAITVLYAAANEGLALAILAVRMGLVQQAVQTLFVAARIAFLAGVTALVRGATYAWIGAQLLLTGVLAAGRGILVVLAAATSGFSLAALAAKGAALLWSGVQAVLNAVLMANPLGVVILLVAGLTAGFIWAFQNVKPFHDLVVSLWTVVTGSLGPAIKTLAEWLKNLLGGAFSWVTDRIGDMLGGIKNLLEMAAKIPFVANAVKPVLAALAHAQKLVASGPAGLVQAATGGFGATPGAAGNLPGGGPGSPGMPDWLKAILAGGSASNLNADQIAQLKNAGGQGKGSMASDIVSAARAQFQSDKTMGADKATLMADIANLVSLEKEFKLGNPVHDAAVLKAQVEHMMATKDNTDQAKNLNAQIALLMDQFKSTGDPALLAKYKALDLQKLLAGHVNPALAAQLASADTAKLAGTAAKTSSTRVPAFPNPLAGFASPQQSSFGGQAIISFSTLARAGEAERSRQQQAQITSLQAQLAEEKQQNTLLTQANRLLSQIAGHGAQQAEHTGQIAAHVRSPAPSTTAGLRRHGVALYAR